jgi:hypothetical protein
MWYIYFLKFYPDHEFTKGKKEMGPKTENMFFSTQYLNLSWAIAHKILIESQNF